jgi:hypothetical protein
MNNYPAGGKVSEFLAVQGLTLGFRDPTHSGTILIIPASVLYTKVKSTGNQVYISISFTVTEFAGPGISSGTGAGVITGSTVKTKVNNGQQPVREEDQVIITITDSVTPFGTLSTTVYVDDAGQTKAKAE